MTTLKSALDELKPPLVFGDERQIAARKFLEKVEEACDAIRGCKRCIGKIDILGFLRRPHSCTATFSEDVREAAIEKINA